MKLFFNIEDSERILSADPLCIILHYSPFLFGYSLFFEGDKTIFKSEIWEKNSDVDPLFFIQKVKDQFQTDYPTSKIFIINYHLRYTAIPASLYTDDLASQWWHLLEGEDPDEKIAFQTGISKDIVHLQAIEADWFQAIGQSFSSIEWVPFQAISFFDNGECPSDCILTLSFIKNNIFITLRSDGQVLFNQGFLYKDPEDILYYLLNTLHLHKINPDAVKLLPEGFIDPDSAVFRLLGQYFKNINWPEPTLLNESKDTGLYSKYGRYHIDKILSCVL